jgi:restriction endonuclease S subunit
VEALDLIYDTIEGNSKLIQNYEKIKKGIIWSSTFNVEKKKLGDMYEIKSGKFNSRDAKEIGLYPFYNSEACSPIGFINDFCFDWKDYLILIKDGGSGQGKYGDNIGLGKIFKVSNKSAATCHQIALVPNKETNNNYFYYYLQNIKNKIMDMAQYTTGLGTIRKSDIENLQIPIPTKEIQEYIVTECEYYDNLIDTLKKENERLQNNKIIKTVLKSVSNDNQLEESKEKESDEELTKVVEEDKPKKSSKESKSKLKN